MFNSWSFVFKIKKGSFLFRGPAPHLFRARDLPFAPSGDILRSVLRISLRRPENFPAWLFIDFIFFILINFDPNFV